MGQRHPFLPSTAQPTALPTPLTPGQTYDYFKTHVESVPHGNRFLFGEHNYLFVAAVNPHSETGTLRLLAFTGK